jgi:hypothetical protein
MTLWLSFGGVKSAVKAWDETGIETPLLTFYSDIMAIIVAGIQQNLRWLV